MRARLLAFCVSAFFAAIAGSCGALYHIVLAQSVLLRRTFSIITMLVIGDGIDQRLDRRRGVRYLLLRDSAQRGAGYQPWLPNDTAGCMEPARFIMSVIFVLVIIFRPKGLLGGRELDLGRLLPGRNRRAAGEPHAVGGMSDQANKRVRQPR